MKEASENLKKKYPEYGEIKVKKTGMTEFRLKVLPSKINYDVKTNVNKKTKKNKKINKKNKNKTYKNKKNK